MIYTWEINKEYTFHSIIAVKEISTKLLCLLDAVFNNAYYKTIIWSV